MGIPVGPQYTPCRGRGQIGQEGLPATRPTLLNPWRSLPCRCARTGRVCWGCEACRYSRAPGPRQSLRVVVGTQGDGHALETQNPLS